MLSFDEVEECFPEGALLDEATGVIHVSAQWLHDFAHAIEAKNTELCAITAWSAGMDEHNKAFGMPCDARMIGSICANRIRIRMVQK